MSPESEAIFFLIICALEEGKSLLHGPHVSVVSLCHLDDSGPRLGSSTFHPGMGFGWAGAEPSLVPFPSAQA